MTHRQVYGLFRDIFPNNYNADTIYFPNGKNSIRLRGTVGLYSDKMDYVFTYVDAKRWRLETVDFFIDRLKGESK